MLSFPSISRQQQQPAEQLSTMPSQITINGFRGDTSQAKPHIILVPLPAQGHVIPLLDFARLLAGAGAFVSFITTPVNSARIRPAIDLIERSGLPIRFVELHFPAAEAGLPAGCENIDLIPSPDLFKPFIESLRLLAPQFKLYLTADSAPSPDCIIFDSMNTWASTVAKSLGIPQLIFYGPSCVHILSCLLLKKNRVLESISDDSQLFPIPGLPVHIEAIKSQFLFIYMPGWEKIKEEFFAAGESAQGVVMNTCEELELPFLEKFREETGKKVWSIGPLSLSNKDAESRAIRGKASSIDTQLLVNWLNSKAASSVLYVSFGSLAHNPLSQLVEIGRGLETALSSLQLLSFIWVVKEKEMSEEGEKWLSEFEERTGRRGMLIRGWAPQTVILEHEAVGGFMTHCGWNSTQEAVVAGVVMVTWPISGDQFLNEKLVVEVLKVGVAVGGKAPTMFTDKKNEDAQVKGEEVRKAVERVMDGGEEGEERRRRARELGEKARKAMEEGGSSFENLKEIILFAKREKLSV